MREAIAVDQTAKVHAELLVYKRREITAVRVHSGGEVGNTQLGIKIRLFLPHVTRETRSAGRYRFVGRVLLFPGILPDNNVIIIEQVIAQYQVKHEGRQRTQPHEIIGGEDRNAK